MRRALVTLLFALALAGCGDGIEQGYITAKEYEEPYMYCGAYTPKGVCSMWLWTEPAWRFDLRDSDKTGWVHVDQSTFNTYAVGDHYPEPQ